MVIGSTPKVEMSVVSFNAFLRAVRSGPVIQLPFSKIIKECDGHGVLMRVPREMINKRFGYGTLRIIDRMEADPTMEFVTVALLCKIEWHVISSNNWYPYQNNTGMLSSGGSSARIIRKMAMIPRKRVTVRKRSVSFTVRISLHVACHSNSPKRLGYCTLIGRWIISGFLQLRQNMRY